MILDEVLGLYDMGMDVALGAYNIEIGLNGLSSTCTFPSPSFMSVYGISVCGMFVNGTRSYVGLDAQ